MSFCVASPVILFVLDCVGLFGTALLEIWNHRLAQEWPAWLKLGAPCLLAPHGHCCGMSWAVHLNSGIRFDKELLGRRCSGGASLAV